MKNSIPKLNRMEISMLLVLAETGKPLTKEEMFAIIYERKLLEISEKDFKKQLIRARKKMNYERNKNGFKKNR
jgi:hypothetical protein